MKVAVVGVGYVGLVAAACLADGGNHVVCVDKIAKSLNKPVIFDGRNLYNPAFVKKQGLEYYSIGRS